MSLRVGVLGGIPAGLGGGGLETQLRETSQALRRRGHDVFHLAAEDSSRAFDILHVFGAEPDVAHALSHWRINDAPLVVSPVLVVPPRREALEILAARAPLRSWGPRMRADTVRAADLVIAQTEHEAALLRRLRARSVVVVPNGVTPLTPADPPQGVPAAGSYVLLLGHIDERKRQRQALRHLVGVPTVIAGGFHGTQDEQAAFTTAVEEARTATWLGEVADQQAVRALLRGARALLQYSRAEGQPLAVLEALSVGTPVLAARLPSTRELERRFPDLVRTFSWPSQIRSALDRLPARAAEPPAIPTWDDVAQLLEQHYTAVLNASPGDRGR